LDFVIEDIMNNESFKKEKQLIREEKQQLVKQRTDQREEELESHLERKPKRAKP